MRKFKFSEFIIPIAVLVSVALLYVIDSNRDHSELELKKITLIAEIDSPGFFEHNNIFYGYILDIMRDYAKYKNAFLDIEVTGKCSELFDILRSGEADFGLTMENYQHKPREGVKQIAFTYEDNYVVISKQKLVIDSLEELIEVMKNKRVAITSAVADTDFFEKYSNPKYDIDFYRDSNKFSREIARVFAYGKADFFICTKTTSALLKYIFKGFNIIYQIPSNNSSSFYVEEGNRKLYNDFSKWYFNMYVGSPAEAYNKNLYNSNEYIRNFIDNGYLTTYNSASPFDDLFKEIDLRVDIDWRVLTSIAHFESRFNRNLVSSVGAVGLMQIMPRVAKSYGFKVDSLKDINYNVYVGGMILNDIRRLLSYKDKVIDDDKMSIMLACYNGGFGHVNDARRLARSRGKDVNKWENIREALSMLKEPEIFQDKKMVKSGKFRANQTIHYVEAVMGRYNEIKKKIK